MTIFEVEREFHGSFCHSVSFLVQILNKNGEPSFDKLLHSPVGGGCQKRGLGRAAGKTKWCVRHVLICISFCIAYSSSLYACIHIRVYALLGLHFLWQRQSIVRWPGPRDRDWAGTWTVFEVEPGCSGSHQSKFHWDNRSGRGQAQATNKNTEAKAIAGCT